MVLKMGDKEEIIVCVTGASGYVAGALIRELLRPRDNVKFRIRGTIRSLKDQAKTKYLTTSFPGLELFEADLLDEHNGFEQAFENCFAVFHTASPFKLVVEDPQRDLLDPAIKGTERVVTTAIQKNVKKIVVTSSIAAVLSQNPPKDPGKVFTEIDWNLDSDINSSPYRLSKRQAEEAAWRIVEEFNKNKSQEDQVKLAVINPGFVIGPPTTPRTDSTSIKTILDFLKGAAKKTKPVAVSGVDLRDVAVAHVNALLRIDSHFSSSSSSSSSSPPRPDKNRFLICSPSSWSYLEYAQALKRVVNEIKQEEEHSDINWDQILENIPNEEESSASYKPNYDNSKSIQLLDLKYKTIEKSLKDMVLYFAENGYLN